KTGVDYVLRGESPGLARLDVCQREPALIRVFNRAGIADINRVNANVVTRKARNERALRRHRPGLEMSFEKVGVLLEKCCRHFIAAIAGKTRSSNEPRDVIRQC